MVYLPLFTYISNKYQANVGKYTSPIDGMVWVISSVEKPKNSKARHTGWHFKAPLRDPETHGSRWFSYRKPCDLAIRGSASSNIVVVWLALVQNRKITGRTTKKTHRFQSWFQPLEADKNPVCKRLPWSHSCWGITGSSLPFLGFPNHLQLWRHPWCHGVGPVQAELWMNHRSILLSRKQVLQERIKTCSRHVDTFRLTLRNSLPGTLNWAVLFFDVPCPTHWVNAYANASASAKGAYTRGFQY